MDDQWSTQENMLAKKVAAIDDHYGLTPSDDLTILRVKF
jgi:hypothetical protein